MKIMAERRMFSKSVIESDPFMDMPAEAQILYIHLNMASDDDGFCDNPRSIMRQCGASNDSMKLLIAKKFVLTFDKNDGFIAVIKHWRLNNYIRKDTYHETKYKEFMRELYYDENQSYSMNSGDGHVPCIPSSVPNPLQVRNEPVTEPSQTRDEPLTQDRLGKDSIEQFSVDQDSTGKGVQGENPSPIYSDPQKKIERIDYWIKRMEFSERQGWDKDCWFNLAAAEGIKRSEIELRIIQLQKQGEQKNEQT